VGLPPKDASVHVDVNLVPSTEWDEMDQLSMDFLVIPSQASNITVITMTVVNAPSKLEFKDRIQADKLVPRDGRLISLILASKGIEDADERVIHQLLDFSHRKLSDSFL
jgi:hypothetical protein